MKQVKSAITCSQTVILYAALVSAAPSAALASKNAHKAHEHGVAQVNIVGEGTTVTVQIESPSDAIYGFEHEAKKPADVKKRDEAIAKLKANADKIFILEGNLSCKIVNSDIKPFVSENDANEHLKEKKKGTHSEVHATFKFECGKPVNGSVMKFAATQFFKSLRHLNVQVLSGEKQTGAAIKNDKGSIIL